MSYGQSYVIARLYKTTYPLWHTRANWGTTRRFSWLATGRDQYQQVLAKRGEKSSKESTTIDARSVK
jgi:hypothetical protein